ncbi:MAG TPA: ATP-dependent DNA ligase, partial [Solirubrobacteraceae bacterium]|nr:ATP-dependent DNA ligase [Solirubrobacteraceae bacterium]
MPSRAQRELIEVCGRELSVSNPGKVFFPERGVTKIDLVNYYLACEEAAVRALIERPTVLKRWVNGVTGEAFFQKRVPESAPDWLE